MADSTEGQGQRPSSYAAESEKTEIEISGVEMDEENVARLLAEEEEEEEKNDHLEQTETEKPSVCPRLFIGGLSGKTTEENLKKHFEQYGTVMDLRIARQTNRGTGAIGTKSRGFGFITMSTMEETEAVLKENHVIDDKIITAMISKPPDSLERKLRLSVTKLDTEKTTEDSLREHFSQFGTVTMCSLSMEQVGGKAVSRGIAFVNMSTEEEVKAAMDKNEDGHQVIDGKMARVKRNIGDPEHYSKILKLWIGGLDKEKTTEADLTEYFSKFGTIQDCGIMREPPETECEGGKSKGYGFIHMTSVMEIGAILKHDGPHVIHDRELVFNRVTLSNSHLLTDLHLVKQVVVSGIRETGLSVDVLKSYFSTHAKVKYVNMDFKEGTATVALTTTQDAEMLAHMRDHFIKKHWVTVMKTLPKAPSDPPERPKKGKQSQHKGHSGFGSRERRFSGDFYDDGPSNYGPVKGIRPLFATPRGGFGSRDRGTGGWVYVENLYEDSDMYSRQQGRKGNGFRGKGHGYGYGSGYGGYGNDGGMGSYYGGGGWGQY